MTYAVIANSILDALVVAVIVGGLSYAIVSSRPKAVAARARRRPATQPAHAARGAHASSRPGRSRLSTQS